MPLLPMLLLLLLPAASVASSSSSCRCVPDQWQGLLVSTDREYDLSGGRAGTATSHLRIHYDFGRRRFAMMDLDTGNKAIADYSKGFKYVVRPDGCTGMPTDEPMRRMCLPDEAELLGEYTVGSDIPVAMWQFNGPYNVSMKTAVMQDTCVPFTEEVTMSRGEFMSVSTSMYLNVHVGIKDESIFTPPANCVVRPPWSGRPRRPESNHVKRTADPARLLKALRNRLYIFH